MNINIACALLIAAVTVVPLEQRGPAVGTHAPEIRARDQFGREQTLQTLMGSRGVLLLFVRSADW
jgi:hypothetical protein